MTPTTTRNLVFLAGALLAVTLAPAGAARPPRAPKPPDPPENTLTIKTDWSGQDNHFVTSVVEDGNGWWWGTDNDGLWHYEPNGKDGRRWTHVRAQDGLYDDSITTLCIDKKGRLWAGTERRGVTIYNGSYWRNYDILTGALGVHIRAIAINPKTSDIWIGSEAGISIYSDSMKKWHYITEANGLPSNKVTCIAFSSSGKALIGSAMGGLMLAAPDGDYKTWSTVTSTADAPLSETGAGLPGNQINCLLVNKAGKIFCGTSSGLGTSTDDGVTWSFLHGWSWQDKVTASEKRLNPVKPADTQQPLAEDYVSCLAFDKEHHLYVGHRQRGFEVIDDTTAKQLYHTEYDSYGFCIKALVPSSGGGVLVGNYGAGMSLVSWDGASMTAEAGPEKLAKAADMPMPATPPSAADLKALDTVLSAAQAAGASGAGYFYGEDWQTQGSWDFRYGHDYALLCSMEWTGDSMPNASPGYSVSAQLGHSTHPGEDFSRWLQWLESNDPRILYYPKIKQGREGEWDDHGERYPQSYDGPDLWLTVEVPAGAHRLSLYLVNKDGHAEVTRFRDFLVKLLPYTDTATIAQTYVNADTVPPIASTRVHDFWPGVYETFILNGPSKYSIKIERNHSLNTILQGVFFDKVGGQGVKAGAAKRGETNLQTALRLKAKLDATSGNIQSASVQKEAGILLLRCAAAANAPATTLSQWRHDLGLWNDDDWDKLRATRAASRTASR